VHQQAPGCRWIPICNTNGGITEKGNSLQEGMAEVYDCSKGTIAYAGEGRHLEHMVRAQERFHRCWRRLERENTTRLMQRNMSQWLRPGGQE